MTELTVVPIADGVRCAAKSHPSGTYSLLRIETKMVQGYRLDGQDWHPHYAVAAMQWIADNQPCAVAADTLINWVKNELSSK